MEEISLPAAVHLAFDELELGDLALGLSVRPWQFDRGADGRFVFAVAAEFGRMAARHAVVTLVPYIDCAGLQKLLSLQSDPSAPGRLSALDVATAIAAALGLGEADFAMAAADSWARSLGRHPVAQRVEAGARLIQATIDAAAGRGLLGERRAIEIAASLPASKRPAGQEA